MINKALIKQRARIEMAKREFWYYCNLRAPDFYKKDRDYLREMCEDMQAFYEDPDAEVLVINAPPRHGKSRTATLFTDWVFGKNQAEKVMTGSYNEVLSTTFSKAVRNEIQEQKADQDKVVYSDIFPGVSIKQGDGAMNLWSLTEGYSNYLATSPTGTATGFGASLMLIDDLIKLSEEAKNDNVLEKHWEWFSNTMLSRLEEGGKIIIIMTRWATRDLAGRVLTWCKETNKRYKHINLRAHLGNGEMLCPEILSYASYKSKLTAMSPEIVKANYDQEPIDLQGRLYNTFKLYSEPPKDENGHLLFTAIKAYIDTADEGSDFLCGLVYGEYNKEAYLLDVLYTKAAMEATEPLTAKMLFENEVQEAMIESNNGGRGFARQVENLLRDMFKSIRTRIKWFHQSKNKKARILSNATWVMDHIYFPVNWRDRWPEFFDSMNSYQREGQNKNDDAQDAITGIAENMNKSKWLV